MTGGWMDDKQAQEQIREKQTRVLKSHELRRSVTGDRENKL